jgi:DNA mismatch repair protein MutS
MRQFLEVKDRYPEAIVFFRLGDFYEMFFEDAVLAARLLELTLTTRDKGKDDAVPMCGVPHHAARGYVARLTELGHRVVICDQTEDAKLAKGLVKREVVRVVTPGVILDEEALSPKSACYVAAFVAPAGESGAGLAYLDASTGEFRATELAEAGALADELARVAPRELVVASAADPALVELRKRLTAAFTVAPFVDAGAARAQLAAAGLEADAPSPLAARAAATVLAYAQATQPIGALPIRALELYRAGDAVVLDETAIANLELVETLMGRDKRGSLLAVIDDTGTAPGGRCLRRWLLYPLTDVGAIRARHDAVEHLVERPALRADARAALGGIHDLERLVGRATAGVATPRDLGKLRDALAALPGLAALLTAGAPKKAAKSALPAVLDPAPLVAAELAALHAALAAALVDDPPLAGKDGGAIRTGHDATVDECRGLADGGKEEILRIEAAEREASGIASLKVRYNRVFGYYLEVTKSHLGKVPAHFVRKQTIATGERYVTPALAELERKVLAAEDTLIERELELLRGLVRAVAERAAVIARAARRLAEIDACAALAEVAHRRGWRRPVIDDRRVIDIVDGRHPVVEALLPDGAFVPNDCHLDPDREQILLITGPNMAGKSTYMRQVAQLVILAQAGSFVPAAQATIGVVDRVFTRVGAADNLARGDSTFMVEMRETAAILAGATARSLIVLDEVGRGTSTYDGVSIAWAIAEHLHDAVGARTLFATHYHELTALAERRPRLRNLSVAVSERNGEIVFLRRVVPGGASKSYGIDVARLAGLPKPVIARARQILGQLERGNRIGGTTQLSLALLDTAPPT